MGDVRRFEIELVSVGLTMTGVRLDGTDIGHVLMLTTARRPKVWFCFDADRQPITDGETAVGGFRSSEEAAFALVRHVEGLRLRDAMLAALGSR